MASRGLIVGNFTALMVFMLSFCAANGLTCYQCGYDTSTTPAGKQFCNATLQVCNKKRNETYCGEIFRKRNDSSTVVEKGCARAKDCVDTHKTCEDEKKRGGYTECSLKCCQSDRCNSAYVTTTNSAFVTTTNSAFVNTTNSAFVTTTNSAFMTTTNSAFMTTTTSTTMLVFGSALVFFSLL